MNGYGERTTSSSSSSSASSASASRGRGRGRGLRRGRGQSVYPRGGHTHSDNALYQQEPQQAVYTNENWMQPQQAQYAQQQHYQQQQQQQQHQRSFASYATEAGLPNNVSHMAAVLDNPLVGSYLKPPDISWMSLNMFRYYFHVSNTYVVNKLKVLLFPCLHKRWSRDRNPHDGGSYKVPSEDLNAPDLYIPLMAFTTYILIMGLIMGITDTFNPEVLGSTASSALAILFFEVAVLRIGLYLIGSNVIPPHILDIIAYSSYKFVILVLDLIVWILSSHNSTVYWIVSLTTGMSMAVFMARTLQRVFVTRVETSAIDLRQRSYRQYFLVLVAVFQVPICLLLGRTITRT